MNIFVELGIAEALAIVQIVVLIQMYCSLKNSILKTDFQNLIPKKGSLIFSDSLKSMGLLIKFEVKYTFKFLNT